MTVSVGKCDECPFRQSDERTLWPVKTEETDPPPWCPLRHEAVVVMLDAAALTAGSAPGPYSGT